MSAAPQCQRERKRIEKPTVLRSTFARLMGPWIFDVGAWPYDWMTANPIWQHSCVQLLSRLPETPAGKLVLDLGIGPGVSAISMGLARPELAFIGVDISLPMLKAAADNRQGAGWPSGRLMLVQADVGRLPFAHATLDMAVGHSFLYLLPDHHAALAQTQRVLVQGGLAGFLEPKDGRPSWGWLVRQGSFRLLISLSLWRFYNWLHGRFSPVSMRESFERAGFDQAETQSALGGFGIYGWAIKR